MFQQINFLGGEQDADDIGFFLLKKKKERKKEKRKKKDRVRSIYIGTCTREVCFQWPGLCLYDLTTAT